MFHAVDEFDGSQNVTEWIRELERASDFASWGPSTLQKVALIRLKGEASEFVSHLQEEGKAKTWSELKAALEERYRATPREQWHQLLLNTSQQEGRTVQEWAQLVRKLSLKSLTPEDRKAGQTPAASGAEGGTGDDQPATSRNGAAAGNALLDYIRRTNFVRGLRPSLRKVVWRKRCSTFDGAVATAAEEEAVEATTHEAEVLSSYRELPSKEELIDSLVAALDIRDEKKRKAGPVDQAPTAVEHQRPAERSAVAAYPEQLPLPLPQPPAMQQQPHHQAYRPRGHGAAGRAWGPAGGVPAAATVPRSHRPWSPEEWEMYQAGVCFQCHERGHIARFCRRRPPVARAGNGMRRPL